MLLLLAVPIAGIGFLSLLWGKGWPTRTRGGALLALGVGLAVPLPLLCAVSGVVVLLTTTAKLMDVPPDLDTKAIEEIERVFS